MAHAHATTEQLQKALIDAKQAAERAQAAAAAAEEVLARVQAAAKTQISTQPTANTAASTPSGISLTGNIDVGLRATTNTDGTKNKSELINNNASTSLIFFKGNKVLSDNLNTSFLLELDFNATQSSTTNGAAASNAFTGTPFTGEQYVALSGGFGDIKLGSPNASGLSAAVTAQPFSTNLGSGFSGTFGRLGTASVSGINQFIGALSGRIIRHEKTVMYTTPGSMV